jgi:hypothetical protein
MWIVLGAKIDRTRRFIDEPPPDDNAYLLWSPVVESAAA